MRYRVILAMLLVAARVYPKDHRDWKQGAVLDIHFSGVSRHGRKVMTYRIDGPGGTYAGEEIAKKRAVGVTVNGVVEYDLDNGIFTSKTRAGRRIG